MNNANLKLQNQDIYCADILLKYGYSIFTIIVGIDKFFGYLAHWPIYVSPYIVQNIPTILTVDYFLYGVGILDIIFGLLLLSRYIKPASYTLALWLVIIGINLITIGNYFDTAMRSFVLAAGAAALGCLSKVYCNKK